MYFLLFNSMKMALDLHLWIQFCSWIFGKELVLH